VGDKSVLNSAIVQLETCEDRLINIYKERTKADESVILDWMKPNNETWVDSKKCLELSICDEVIKPSKERTFQANPEDIKNKTPEEIFAAYEGDIPIEIKNKTKSNMKNRIISMLAAASIVHTLTASSDDADFEAVLSDVFSKAGKTDAAEAKLKTFQSTNAKVLINKAVEDGKITASEKEEWLKDAEANYDFAVKAISKMSGKVDPNAIINKDNEITPSNNELLKGREAWDFDKWQAEDSKGLETLEDKFPDEFEKLFNAKFKK